MYLSISRSFIISSPPALLGLIILREIKSGELFDEVPQSSDGEIYRRKLSLIKMGLQISPTVLYQKAEAITDNYII